MNYWTKLSAEFAQQRNYLDELYKVYPIVPNIRRKLKNTTVESIRNAFESRNNMQLIKQLLELELFPIKDSYIAFLKRDKSSISKNPDTVNRIAGNLYQIGFDEIIEKCTEPKETNRQIGPMFKNWIDKGTLGAPVLKDSEEFLNCSQNCILNTSDDSMGKFCRKYLGFNREKGIDFMAKFNRKYIIAETKFLTDFGSHQNAQFDDAIKTMTSPLTEKNVDNEVIQIAIMDGVLYIKGNTKMYRYLQNNQSQIIISSLLLREFLYSL